MLYHTLLFSFLKTNFLINFLEKMSAATVVSPSPTINTQINNNNDTAEKLSAELHKIAETK